MIRTYPTSKKRLLIHELGSAYVGGIEQYVSLRSEITNKICTTDVPLYDNRRKNNIYMNKIIHAII